MAKRTGILATRMTTELTTKAKQEVVKVPNPGTDGRGEKSSGAITGESAAPDRDGRPTLDEAIRLGAYLKWEAAGMPGGDGIKYWLEAEQEILRKNQGDRH